LLFEKYEVLLSGQIGRKVNIFMRLGLTWARNKETFAIGLSQSILNVFNKVHAWDVLIVVICAMSFAFSFIESLVNIDSMHWGWAYITALDVKRGAIPHSEVLISYGYLYTLLQSFALYLFGERLVSLGIITGLFYALALWLSYRIFLRFLKRKYAFLAVLFIFLVHPHIIYPAPNYMMYTFELLALIFFMKYPEKKYYALLAGFSLGLSVLCRYSSSIAIVPPFIVLLCWQYFNEKGKESIGLIKSKIRLMTGGFFFPLTAFFIYLIFNAALDDFIYQNAMSVKLMGQGDDIRTYLNFLASIFQIEESLASDFRGKLFTVVLLVCLFLIIRQLVMWFKGRAMNSLYSDGTVLAVCVVVVFNYLNSIHIYETYRLVNGASLGFGVCAFVVGNCVDHSKNIVKYIILIILSATLWALTSTLFFERTTSSYYPWKKEIIFGHGITVHDIKIFQGKRLSKEYHDFYREVFDILRPFEKRFYLLNFTWDSVAAALNDMPRVQISPYNAIGVDDLSKQARLIAEKRAIIISYKKMDFQGYKTIFARQWPDEIPWLGGGYLFISVPETCSADNPS